MFFALSMLLTACTDATVIGTEKITNTDDTATEEELLSSWVFTVNIAQEATVGQDIPYTVELKDELQERVVEDIVWTVQSDMETLFYTTEFISPTVAGLHTLTFSTDYEGTTYTAEATIDLSPSEIDLVDLQLSDHVLSAGGEISYDVLAFDRFGNELDTSAVSVDLQGPEPSDTTMGSELITSTTPGLYTIAASIGNVQDVELLQVLAGPTVSITLDVPQGNVEINDTLACTITTVDEFGNETDDPWTMTTTAAANIFHNNITFLEEDYYDIRVELDSDTSIFDTYGTIMVDSTGPLIEIISPERGSWDVNGQGNVTGNVFDYPAGLDLLTIDGDIVTPDGAGYFSYTKNFVYGFNWIETRASDIEGNESIDRRSVLSGSFHPKDQRLEEGITIFLGDNNDGLGALEEYAEGYISDLDISSMLPQGNIVDESDCAWNTWWGCALSYSFRLKLTDASYGSAALDISTHNDGTIHADVTISQIDIDYEVRGTVDNNGSVTANNATINMVLTPSVSNDQLGINLDSVQANISGINFNAGGLLGDVIDFFGIDGLIEGEIESFAIDALQDVVTDTVPETIESVLSEFSIEENFDVMGTTYTLSSVPSDVFVNNAGLTLYMTSNLTGDSWVQPSDGLGSLTANITAPAWSSGTGLGINLNLDIINQLLYQAWGGGILALNLDTNTLGIDSDDLSIIFPNATDLRITVDALLPPAAVENNGAVELQAGDIYIAVHNGELSAGDVRLELYASLTAPMEISIVNNTITPTIGEPTLSFNVVHPNNAEASSTETLLSALVPYIIPNLENLISGIELPQLGDFGFANLNSSIGDNHLNASAKLETN